MPSIEANIVFNKSAWTGDFCSFFRAYLRRTPASMAAIIPASSRALGEARPASR